MRTTGLHIATGVIDGGGIRNIPFLGPNASASRLHATFRIETVKRHDGSTFLQLQYTQGLLLDFNGLIWPHVSVANLGTHRRITPGLAAECRVGPIHPVSNLLIRSSYLHRRDRRPLLPAHDVAHAEGVAWRSGTPRRSWPR